MITIVAVNQTGMFSYALMPTVQVNGKGRVFIRGVNEDNGGSCGSGKSSFLNGIKEVLFAKNDSGKSGVHVVNKHAEWLNGMFGVVWLVDHNGVFWRIMSIRKWKGGTPDFIKNDGPSEILASGQEYTGSDVFIEWKNPTTNLWIDGRPTARKDNKSKTDAQAYVATDILKMTYEQFSAYVCLGQKAESALVSGTSGAREKVIQAVADVSVWSKAADIIKAAYTEKLTNQNNLKYEIAGMKSVLATIYVPGEEEIQGARNLVEAAKIEGIRLQAQLDEISQRCLEANQNRTALNADGVDDGIALLQAEERNIRQRYEDDCAMKKNSRLPKMEKDLGKLRYDFATYSLRLKDYQELGEGDCDKCGQVITGDHLHTKIDKYRKAVVQIDLTIHDLREDITAEHNTDSKTQQALEEKARALFDRSMQKIQDSMVSLEERKRKSNYLDISIQGLNREYRQLQQQIQAQPINIQAAESSLNSMLSKVQERQQAQTKLQDLEDNYAADELDIEHMKWTERNLKKLRVQEYESAIHRLNQLLEARLWELWGSGLQARFVTATSTTRGSNIKSGLEFLVDTPKKQGVPIELYSGGETKIIVIAMFLSMIELSRERGGGIDFAAIDEIDTGLDDHKTDRLVDAVEAVVRSVSTCLIISHNTRLLNTMEFDETWTMRKSNEFASIEIDNGAALAA